MNGPFNQIELLVPVAVVLLASLAAVFAGLMVERKDRYLLSWVSVGGCVLSLVTLIPTWFGMSDRPVLSWLAGPEMLLYSGAIAVDGLALSVSVVALIAGAFAALCGWQESDDSPLTAGEYHGLLLLAVAGMMLLGMAHDFATLLVGLEIMSVSTYILTASRRGSARGGEAALKYLVLGAFSTAFLLLGMAFLYGATGRLQIGAVAFGPNDPRIHLALVGFGLLLAGVLFKVGAVPFHFWIPDVYDGAPTPVTSLMATGVKAAAFAVMGRVVFEMFGGSEFVTRIFPLLASVAILTMLLGNLIALHQESVKRMLAYSAIAHTGYLLMAFLLQPGATGAQVWGDHLRSAAFYLLTYAFSTAGAFAIVALAREDGKRMEKLDEFRGFARTHPGLALCMTVFLLSLAGLPPLGGFFAKFLVFRGAIEQGFVVPAVVGILTSVASLGYYLRVVQAMYLTPEADASVASAPCRPGWTVSLLTYGAALAILVLGLLPNVVANRMADVPGPQAVKAAAAEPAPANQISLATSGEHEGRRLP
jgi:NADH-quinone oxidoreductase subunit N